MTRSGYTDDWLSDLDLKTVVSMLIGNGATEILYKVLPRNANSKNQVYLGADLSQLGKIPSGEVTAHQSTSEKSGAQEAVFRSALDFFWLDKEGRPRHAPRAKLIFYPQFPEVRLSGFLQGCSEPPSSLWVKERRGQEPDRILLLGLGSGRRVLAVTLPPESPGAKEILATGPHDAYGALCILPLPGKSDGNGYLELMGELCRIHHLSWVDSSRLDPAGRQIPCAGTNCNGNTLESLLGIRSNGYSLPDFMGWEVKARLVTDLAKPGASTVTLFTPEPTAGFYKDAGVSAFVRRYGYPDTKGRDDRLNFGGVYRAGSPAHHRTGVRLVLDGFDAESGKFQSSGAVMLLDKLDHVAASWPFTKLLDHWKVKHAHVAFVPSEQRKLPSQQYSYGREILIGEGAEFRLLLTAINKGKVYYDPGIKLEDASTGKAKAKKRSQFRVASGDLEALYESCSVVDACAVKPVQP